MGATALVFCLCSTMLLGAAIFSTVTMSREGCPVRRRGPGARR